MPQYLKHLFCSLYTRLIALFVIAGLSITAILVGSLMFFGESNFQRSIIPKIVNHMTFIEQEIGYPPDYEKAIALAKEINADIYLFSNNIQWCSNINVDTKEMQTTEFKSNSMAFTIEHPKLSYGTYGHEKVMKWQAPHYNIYLTDIGSPIDGIQKLKPLSIIIMMVFCIITICYLITLYLFSPLKKINHGIEEFSKGNFKYIIDVNRKDEFNLLTERINNMACEINNILEAKRQLLLAISHELRTPITRAHISAAMLQQYDLKKDIQNDLREMEKLISNLLESERLNTPHQTLNKSVASINTLLQDIKLSFEKQAIEVIELKNDIYLELDVVRIQLLLKNLINNAIKYSSNTSKKIEVYTRLETSELIFAVQDYGEGIAKQHIKKLTEPFYRADASRQRQTGGFGLGLYLCDLIAKAHGGKLEISSKLNEGTLVLVSLPIENTNQS